MAIKDLIGPGFVGTSTIKWIVTRGLSAASVTAPDSPGIEFKAQANRLHFVNGTLLHYKSPANKLHYQARDEDK